MPLVGPRPNDGYASVSRAVSDLSSDCPAGRTANENAACRRPYLRERVPQNPPGEMPGHGAPYGTSATQERINHSVRATGLQHLLLPRYSNRQTEPDSVDLLESPPDLRRLTTWVRSRLRSRRSGPTERRAALPVRVCQRVRGSTKRSSSPGRAEAFRRPLGSSPDCRCTIRSPRPVLSVLGPLERSRWRDRPMRLCHWPS
jgi:hypothetical protein